jgi:hypothetical protein
MTSKFPERALCIGRVQPQGKVSEGEGLCPANKSPMDVGALCAFFGNGDTDRIEERRKEIK